MSQQVLNEEIDSDDEHKQQVKSKKIVKEQPRKKKNELNLTKNPRDLNIIPEKRKRKSKGAEYKLLTSSQDDGQSDRKSRKISGAKLGRPFREKKPKAQNKHQLLIDPSINMQQYFLQYFAEIGLTHGLTFRQEQRKFLSERLNPKIKWNAKDEWDPDIEKKKLQQDERIQSILKKYIPRTEIRQSLIYSFLSIGDFAASEATQDIYLSLAEVIQSLHLEESEAQQEERRNRILEQLPFISGKFTEERKKYWLQIQDGETINKCFERIFKKLKRELKKFLDSDQIQNTKTYFLQQEQMRKQLQDILKNNRQTHIDENI